MTAPIQSQGYKSNVWKLFGREKPHQCPQCQKEQSLRYVGKDTKYSLAMCAKLYRCESCDSWLDLVWERRGVPLLSNFKNTDHQTLTVRVIVAT